MVTTNSVFITPYLAFKFYNFDPFKQNIEIKFKNINFKLDKSTIFSFNMFRLMCCFYYTVYSKDIDYANSFYIYQLKIDYTFNRQRYSKIFEIENLRDFYECNGQFSRDNITEFYRSLEGRYAEDKDYRYYVFNSNGCDTDLVIVTDYSKKLSDAVMIKIFTDLRYKSIFEFHAPRNINVGIHYEYRDDEYSGLVSIR